MIYIRDNKVPYMFDAWEHLGPKRRKLLEDSWAGLFRENILPNLPVDKMAPFFDAEVGRHTKEMYTVLGTLILQQMHDLSDEETIQQLAFNEQWHYALDIISDSDKITYMCPKTLWAMRKIITDNDLHTILFNTITGSLANGFGVDTNKQRLDSINIKSNMRRLGRIGIFTKTIHKFLVNLKRHHLELYEAIDKGLLDKYLTDKSLQCFSQVRPSESAKTLATVSEDLFQLGQLFRDHPEVCNMTSYKLLLQVQEDQCKVTEGPDGQPEQIALKAPKEISSASIQNPSDPDAGYDGHKGQGYQVQVMETYSDEEDEEIKSRTLKLITYVKVEPANESDANAIIPALESTQERNLGPEEVLADSLYGSDNNCQDAEEIGVELISPVMGVAPGGSKTLADFTYAEDQKMTSCPNGHAPVQVKANNKGYSAAFDSGHCLTCSFRDGCPVKQGKKYNYIHYDSKMLRLAGRRALEQTDEFKKRYRYRSGVEATMSEYKTRTGVKRLRVRGLKAVRFCATLKAIGVNIFRATAVRKARNRTSGASEGINIDYSAIFLIFKEHLTSVRGRFMKLFTPDSYFATYELKLAV
jgi:hypothetical protein